MRRCGSPGPRAGPDAPPRLQISAGQSVLRASLDRMPAKPALHAMFVHAHPDDESSKGAATMARYAKEGYRISVVTCTDGMQGDILNPAMDRPGIKERMKEIRAEELARALEILGVTDHFNLGYPDSGYVEDFKGDGTLLAPDCFFNVAAFAAAGDPERFPDAGPPWQPAKLYYLTGHNRARVQALHEACLELGLESPWAEWLEKRERPDPE